MPTLTLVPDYGRVRLSDSVLAPGRIGSVPVATRSVGTRVVAPVSVTETTQRLPATASLETPIIAEPPAVTTGGTFESDDKGCTTFSCMVSKYRWPLIIAAVVVAAVFGYIFFNKK